MDEDTSINVQKIKERLFELGQSDIDDSVIFELLCSVHNAEEIIELITGSRDSNNITCYKNWSISSQKSQKAFRKVSRNYDNTDNILSSDISSTASLKAVNSTLLPEIKRRNINKESDQTSKSIENCKMEYSNDNIIESSDYDSEDEHYYENLYTDDYFDSLDDNNINDKDKDPKKDSSSKNIIQNSSDALSINMNKESLVHLSLYRDPQTSVKDIRTDEIELLEENNNDPNNNLDTAQFQFGSSSELIDLNNRNDDEEVVIVSGREGSPQPSCSKDFNPEPSRIQLVLRQETNQILGLLPRFKYGLVYKTLNKYWNASNRIECTLKEILLSEKSTPGIQKRKSMEVVCTSESKKHHYWKMYHPKKRQGKCKIRPEIENAEDCIIVTEHLDAKEKDVPNEIGVQTSKVKITLNDALNDASQGKLTISQKSSKSDDLIYPSACPLTKAKPFRKVYSERLLEEVTINNDAYLLKKMTSIPATARNVVAVREKSINVFPSVEKKEDISEQAKSNTEVDISQINASLITNESEHEKNYPSSKSSVSSKNIVMSTASSRSIGAIRRVRNSTVYLTQNVMKEDIHVQPQKEIKSNEIESTLIKKENTLLNTMLATSKEEIQPLKAMDITVNSNSIAPLREKAKASSIAMKQDNNLIFSSGNGGPIKNGILTPAKLVIAPAHFVRPKIPKSRSFHNILAPPKLLHANVSSTNSMAIPSSVKFSNTKMIRDQFSDDKKNQETVSVSNNLQKVNNSKDDIISKTVAHEVPSMIKPGSKDQINSYCKQTALNNLQSTSDYNMSTTDNGQKQISGGECIMKKQEHKGQPSFLKVMKCQNVEESERVQGDNHVICKAVENDSDPLESPSVSKKVPFSEPIRKSHQMPKTTSSSKNLHKDNDISRINIEVQEFDKAEEESRISTMNPMSLTCYNNILSMFPDVDPVYIKEQYNKFVGFSNATFFEENNQFNKFVEHLLGTGSQHPCAKDSNEEQRNYDVKECYSDLLDLFPKADPSYLRIKAEEFFNRPEERKNFIETKLENPNYPTREEYMVKKRITEQQKQYTTNFSVVQFLEICPDPFSKFENKQRQCIFQRDALEFLYCRFYQVRKETLGNVYLRNNYNMSLTAKQLEETYQDTKMGQHIPLYLATENIPLLQEMAFIIHKVELQNYICNLKIEEAKEIERLKLSNELLQCQCCFDPEVIPSKCASCDEGHIFCYQCIQTGVQSQLGDGGTRIQCFLDCGKEFSISILQRVLVPTTFSILIRKRQEAEVMAAGLEGLVSCPFCHFASIPPLEDKVFKCFNPDCMKETCRYCKELNHVPLKCEEANAENVRHILEEKMTEALVRKCYKCKRSFFKEEGCNRMTCICGATMCYICDEPITGYTHFSGQGSNRKDLCPLWSDNHRINAQTVAVAAEETVKELRKAHPEVQIDAATLVPQVPQGVRGPHDDIPHSSVIPKRAYIVPKDSR